MGPWTEHRYRGITMDGSDHRPAGDGGEYSLAALKPPENPGNAFRAISLVEYSLTL